LVDGAVLFSTDAEQYFGLNHVGVAIWRLLPPASHSFDELCAALGALYPDAARETLATDAASLLDELLRERLVVPPGDAPPAAG
ncbi:MAG TPA: PqqD family protein, partial [Gemmatimonadaceae bacterium]|nr:PqqD family protein [Gemmatimonadaceae bacterium]